jgi:hypothetical protein
VRAWWTVAVRLDGLERPGRLPGGSGGREPRQPPTLPAGYAPYGIQTIGQRIFVSYAQQDADKEEEVPGTLTFTLSTTNP